MRTIVVNGRRYVIVGELNATHVKLRRTFGQWARDQAQVVWIWIRALLCLSVVACGGESFEYFPPGGPVAPDGPVASDGPAPDAPPAGERFDAGSRADAPSDSLSAPDRAGPDARPDVAPDVDAAPDVVDAAPDAAPRGLCCGAAVCSSAPWFCCLGGACVGGSANCGAVRPDGGSFCRAGDPCGLIGGPATNTIEACQ
jgi:hypothetical protein